jgi:hypothetical protein
MAESSSHNAMHVAVPLQMRLAALRRRPHLERRRAVSRAGALADAARVSAVVSPQRSHHFSVIANFAKHNERPTTHSKRASHHSSSSLSPTRRGVSVVPRAAAVAATAANAVAAAVGPSVPEMACAASLGYLVAAFVAFWLGVKNPEKFEKCARFTKSPMSLAPPCVAYLGLLVMSWSPDTLSLMMPGSLEQGLTHGKFNPQFFPSLDGIAQLLSRRAVTSSAWMHLACVNLFVARHASLKAAAGGWGVAHTLLITFVFGPFGLFSHWATSALRSNSSRGKNFEKKTMYGEAYGHGYGGGPAYGPGKRSRSTKHKFALMSSLF